MKYIFTYSLVVLLGSTLAASPESFQLDSASFKEKDNNQRQKSWFLKSDSTLSFRSPEGYFPSLLSNFADQATAPFRFKTKQWLITGATIGVTAALIHFDNKIDGWADVQKQNHEWVNKSSPAITKFGSIYGISTIAAVGLVSVVFKNRKGAETSMLATQALITSEVWTQLIKLLMGSEHPVDRWWGPFPSGHTTAAFSMATVFALQYRDTKVIPVLCYSAATLVGISRLTEQAHWASDVFLGGLIGYICGKQVVVHHNKLFRKPLPDQRVKPEFSFIQVSNQIGIRLKW